MRLRKIKGASEYLKKYPQFVITNPVEHKGKWQQIFNNKNDLVLEIGCGKGQFIIEMAKKYPNKNFIGIEKFDSVLIRALEKLKETELTNIRLIHYDAFEIENIFLKEINTIYLTFSDPWPKAKHAKRRLTHQSFLTKFEKIVKDEIIFKTDNLEFFKYSIETMRDYGMNLLDVNTNLISDVENLKTEFEEKFSNLGFKINRVIAKYKGDKNGK